MRTRLFLYHTLKSLISSQGIQLSSFFSNNPLELRSVQQNLFLCRNLGPKGFNSLQIALALLHAGEYALECLHGNWVVITIEMFSDLPWCSLQRGELVALTNEIPSDHLRCSLQCGELVAVTIEITSGTPGCSLQRGELVVTVTGTSVRLVQR